MKTPEKEVYVKLASISGTALQELRDMLNDETLRRACGFKSFEVAAKSIISRALRERENIIRQWEAENPEPE